mmetsp:Transcript_15724/g.42622  ORF Transcript_15724/g.42622 Transcript_15724/m.42622 type:complete len:217 (-) Transcript_15724:1135-1785(-)
MAQHRAHALRPVGVASLVVVGVDVAAALLPLLHVAAAVLREARLEPVRVLLQHARRVGGELPVGVGEDILEVVLGDGVRAPLAREDGALVEVTAESLGLEGGAHEEHAQLRPRGEQLAYEEDEEVGLRVALVHLVHHDVRDVLERVVTKHHAQRDAGRAEEDARLVGALRVEAHLVADLVTHGLAALRGDTLGEGDGGDAARLRAEDKGAAAARIG